MSIDAWGCCIGAVVGVTTTQRHRQESNDSKRLGKRGGI